MSDLTLTNGELLQAVPGLQRIGARELSVIAAYVIAKAKRKINTELQDLEAARLELCERYAVRDEDEKPVKLESGSYEIGDTVAFEAAWRALLAEPVTLSGVRSLSLSELNGCPITPDELFSLGPFVTEPPEPEAPSK